MWNFKSRIEVVKAETSGKSVFDILKFKKLIGDGVEALLKGRVSCGLSETGDFF